MKVATKVPDLQAEVRETTRLQVLQWFEICDRILDVHRSNFVYREATAADLEAHKLALKLTLRICRSIHLLIADPDFDEPDLVSRLQVRIQQLEDAYNTFHDRTLSDEKAEQRDTLRKSIIRKHRKWALSQEKGPRRSRRRPERIFPFLFRVLCHNLLTTNKNSQRLEVHLRRQE